MTGFGEVVCLKGRALAILFVCNTTMMQLWPQALDGVGWVVVGGGVCVGGRCRGVLGWGARCVVEEEKEKGGTMRGQKFADLSADYP